MSQRFDYYNTGDDGTDYIYSSRWLFETFVAQANYQIISVKLKAYRTNATTNLTVSIRATDPATGKPTGADLCSKTVAASVLGGSPGSFYEFVFTSSYNLAIGTRYAIVFRMLGGSSFNYVFWRKDTTSSPYTNGASGYSTNSGVNWTFTDNQDFMFECWGNLIIQSPTAQTDDASDIAIHTAVLNGKVLNDGGEACQVAFDYGLTDAYGLSTGWESGYETNDLFFAEIADLIASTTYHFRAKVKNSAGTAYGADKEFTTAAIPAQSKKVVILHPGIKDVFVYQEGFLVAAYENLSNLDEGRLENVLEISVVPPAQLDIVSVAGIHWLSEVT